MIFRSASWYKKHPSNTKGRAWKFKKGKAYKDYDGDGRVNRYDCRPLDPRRKDRGLFDTRSSDEEREDALKRIMGGKERKYGFGGGIF